jgi:hypothetical protein
MDTITSIKYKSKNSYIDNQNSLPKPARLSHEFDSAKLNKLQNGDCTFFADHMYYNGLLNEWRRFLCIVRVSNQKYHCVDSTLYNSNKDTEIIDKPLPN